MPELLVASDANALDRIGLALSDPIRRGVLLQLLHEPACPSDLAERLGTSRSNLSNHLACLRGCGLIQARRSGRYLHYELTSPALADALSGLVDLARVLPECQDHQP